MSFQRDVRSVTYLKTRAAQLLAQVNETRRPVVITQEGRPKAVLQDPESYERLRAAVGLLKLIAQGEKDASEGRVSEQDKLFADLESALRRRSKND